MANKRFADLANMKSLFAGLKSKYAGKGEAVKSVTRAGTTFTATMADGTTFSFDQQDTTYTDATQSAHGLMSAADKAKLDSVEEGANAYSLPEMSPTTRGGAKLEEHGGLVLRDEKLGIGSLVQESDGYARGGLAEVTAKGHAEQATTSGKNLLDLRSSTGGTDGGVTAIPNGDGTFKVTGQATSESINIWLAGRYASTTALFTLPAGTYTVSDCRLFSNTSSINMVFLGGRAATVTLSQATAITGVRFPQCTTNQTVNTTIRPQIELGSTATEYEPYTGGAPSPSPDYPQEIKVARGRNLLENTATSQTINGIAFTKNADGSVTANGTATATINYYLCRFVTLPAGTYTISGAPSATSNSLYNVRCEDTAYPNTQRMRNDGSTGSSNQPTGAIPANTPQDLLIRIYNGTTLSNLTFYPQLELGSTSTPYVPYGYVGMEAHTANLFNLPDSSMTVRGITAVVKDGVITLNGTNNEGTTAWFNWDFSSNPIPAGTYTLSLGNDSTNNDVRITLFNGGTAIGEDIRATAVDRHVTMTLTQLITRLSIAIGNGITLMNFVMRPQIEVGSAKTAFAPYFHTTTPIPLPDRGWVGSLPDGTVDVLTLDGAGKVEWELDTDEAVYSGNETWLEFGGRVYTNDSRIPKVPSADTLPSAMCTHFVVITNNSSQRGSTGFSFGTNGNNIAFNDGTGSMTIAAWTTWLSTHPVTVLYQLATPVIEELGYIDPPSIDGDCQISIPELDELGVKYFVDDSAGTLARQWYERAQSEYETRLSTLESIVAGLV